jgi:hypothetical protein
MNKAVQIDNPCFLIMKSGKEFDEKRLNHLVLILQTSEKRPIEVHEHAGYENFSSFV